MWRSRAREISRPHHHPAGHTEVGGGLSAGRDVASIEAPTWCGDARPGPGIAEEDGRFVAAASMKTAHASDLCARAREYGLQAFFFLEGTATRGGATRRLA